MSERIVRTVDVFLGDRLIRSYEVEWPAGADAPTDDAVELATARLKAEGFGDEMAALARFIIRPD